MCPDSELLALTERISNDFELAQHGEEENFEGELPSELTSKDVILTMCESQKTSLNLLLSAIQENMEENGGTFAPTMEFQQKMMSVSGLNDLTFPEGEKDLAAIFGQVDEHPAKVMANFLKKYRDTDSVFNHSLKKIETSLGPFMQGLMMSLQMGNLDAEFIRVQKSKIDGMMNSIVEQYELRSQTHNTDGKKKEETPAPEPAQEEPKQEKANAEEEPKEKRARP